MKYISSFRDKDLVKKLITRIHYISKKQLVFMEVCGGHTMSVQKFGIPSLLPDEIKLISGPGCPVCVTSRHFIDKAVAYSRLNDCIITTYGDLIKVPGSTSNLAKEKASGANIIMVYSTLEAINIAKQNPDKKVLFLGIGFETTTPSTAVAISEAKKQNIKNFYILSSHKIMPPAMEALIDKGVNISGYIAPGHVSTITGIDMYKNIPENFNIPVVISGFEPVDILQSVLMLIEQCNNEKALVEIQYKRAVRKEGNPKAIRMVNEIFKPNDDWWRGLGILKNSGMVLNDEHKQYDADKQMPIEVEKTIEPKGCICGEILKGLKRPDQCPLFAKICIPSSPVGACMVSNEGACQAYYKYNHHGR